MIISQTPVRLSIFGGNTDFKEYFLEYGGTVLTATLDKYIYCIVKKRFDDLIIVNYSIKEIVENVNDLKHDLVREALKFLKITRGIEISFLADIPSKGTGLGSSSSIVVGVLNALHTYLGENVNSEQLAREAIQIELDILKNPIGIQDQYAVAFGGLRIFEFEAVTGLVKTRKIEITDSIYEDFNNSLMLFYTGITRKSKEILQNFNIADNISGLAEKKTLVIDGERALNEGNLGDFGKLLAKSWATKRKANTETTTSEIDVMCQKALNAGAIGVKVIGAGGGGFLLVMFSANKRAKIREALKNYKEMPFRFNDFGSRIIFNL